MKRALAAVMGVCTRARIAARVYNLGRRVLPPRARLWVRTVLLRRPPRRTDFTALVGSQAGRPSGPAAAPDGAGSRRLSRSASVVIVTYNNKHLTELCLESVRTFTAHPNVEIIVVDNASSDGTPDAVAAMQAAHPRLRLIRNSENRGFAGATNQGLVAASGEVLVLLNNDTVVTRGWLSGLIRHLVADPSIGMTGPVTNASGNESCIEVGYTSLQEMHAFAGAYGRAHAGEMRTLPMLSMFCVAFRRDVFERVGLLDERFGIGMFEDDDYAWRVRALGYRCVCVEDVFVHHFGRSAFKGLDAARYDELFERNRRLFEDKWHTVWERHAVRR